MDCYLQQHVHQPTRLNNILDLVFTSEIQIRNDILILAPVDNLDHNDDNQGSNDTGIGVLGIGQYLPVLGGIGIAPILFLVIVPNTAEM